ncbi:MAG: serine--tRNA ligase [Leptospirales bacterium]
MIDQNIILNDFEAAKMQLQRKGVTTEELEKARDAFIQKREIQQEIEKIRAERNSASKKIGELLAAGKKDEAEALKTEVSGYKEKLEKFETDYRDSSLVANDLLLRLPNFPEEEAPEGLDETSNIIIHTEGYNSEDYKDKTYLPHWDLATNMGIYDQERGSKITGSMFSVLKGDGARLLRSLVQFALTLNEHTYMEHVVPTFVNSDTFTATGHLPKFSDDAYHLEKDGYWAIPTGEVPLTGMHRDEILDENTLPRRYMAYTSCFRREAGSAGKETRGMQRLHEFHKVELVKICKPEQVEEEFNAMLEDVQKPLQLLNLPYRIVDLCAGDLTFSSSRIYDIEVYSPGVDKWLEVSSVGKFSNFQARRGNIRYKHENKGKSEFVHFLNGSAMATPRVWAAILEHYQLPDGSVQVPEALRQYLGKDKLEPVLI